MKLGNKKPVDAVATRVISNGESFEYKANGTDQDSELPLPITKATKAQLMNPKFKDLTGSQLGRLVVLGRSVDRKGRWVCRCVCARYALRSAAAIAAAAQTPLAPSAICWR